MATFLVILLKIHSQEILNMVVVVIVTSCVYSLIVVLWLILRVCFLFLKNLYIYILLNTTNVFKYSTKKQHIQYLYLSKCVNLFIFIKKNPCKTK